MEQPYIDPAAPALLWMRGILNEEERKVIQAIFRTKCPDESNLLRGRKQEIEILLKEIEKLSTKQN